MLISNIYNSTSNSKNREFRVNSAIIKCSHNRGRLASHYQLQNENKEEIYKSLWYQNCAIDIDAGTVSPVMVTK